jgi:hypothetical protein
MVPFQPQQHVGIVQQRQSLAEDWAANLPARMRAEIVGHCAELVKAMVPPGLEEIDQLVFVPQLGLALTNPGIVCSKWQPAMQIG